MWEEVEAKRNEEQGQSGKKKRKDGDVLVSGDKSNEGAGARQRPLTPLSARRKKVVSS